MPTFSLDAGLLDAVRAGRAVLFLGAGASFGASKAGGGNIPTAAELTRRVVAEFLGPGYEDLDFKSACDLAGSARSIRELQSFLHRELTEYGPANFHLLLPTFVWAGLATTNYDLVIERAYDACEQPAQELVPYCRDGDGATDKLGARRLLYVKLHGCITHYQEVNPPLVASTEQIINHREGRAGQFAQFLEWAKTKTIIFAGYALTDSNLRALVEEIRKEGDNRPRHYIVRPGVQEAEARYWAERRVQAIATNFEDFVKALDQAIRPEARRLALAPAAFAATTFTKFISKAGVTESSALRAYLESHCEHVSEETVADNGDPKRFYNGFDLEWYPFAADLDVPRRVTRAVFDEQVILHQATATTHLIVIKASAGAGKSVVLRRLAWDTAKTLKRLVFFLEHAGAINVDLFEEIVSLTNQTIFLFIDDLAESAEDVLTLLKRAKAQRWRIVVIGGARFNEWNVRCEALEPLLDAEYEIGYLSHPEIDDLLLRLEQHDCLGHLATLPWEDRRKQLREIYGRQLLVALHEATKNASFRDIVRNEFNNISPKEAQVLYLDICALHRFGPPVRAGLIARVHGIGFDEFGDRFFKPLQAVVELKRDAKTGDWVYRARHSYIATMVYSEILASVDEKFDHIMRVVTKLNPGYSYDREVLFELIRAGTLVEVFRDRRKGDAVYEAALSSIGREAHILHQRGIYEMRLGADPATLDRAEAFFNEALDLATNSRPIRHSLAELALARSKIARDEIERDAWRRRAEVQAAELAKASHNSYPHHTLAKAAVATVRECLEKTEAADDELSQEALSQAIKHAEDVLRAGLQRFPNDDHLLNEEAALAEILQNADRALRALHRAFDSNPQSELIARRLARVLGAKGRIAESIDVLRRGLDQNPGSQALNYDLAQNLRLQTPDADTVNNDTILYHLSRSFSPGDRNHQAQFWYARQLCLAGRGAEAQQFFSKLRQLQLPYKQKRSPRGIVLDRNGDPVTFYGQIFVRQPSFAFIKADRDGLNVYCQVKPEDMTADALQIRQRVTYQLGFTLFGPVALNVTALLL